MKKGFIPEKLYRKIISFFPLPCVDLVIKKRNYFLLVKRGEMPVKNKWWFAGGRILFNESLTSAVERKLKEELNIRSFRKIKFLGVKETMFKKSRVGKPTFSINNVFLVEVSNRDVAKIKSDKTMKGYKWFKKIENNFPPYIKQFLKIAGFK